MKLKVAYALVGTTITATSLGGTTAFADNPPRTLAALSTNSAINPAGNSDFSTTHAGYIQGNLIKIATSVLDVLFLLSGILAVFYLVYSGIQYITSAGNADRVKTARAGIINSVIGIIIIVAAFFIIRIAVSIGDTAANSQCINSNSGGSYDATSGTCSK